ncbi:P-loop containing nucleoside triphosphate hydrolase protein [Fusarium redolens]|uniref:P-loop containing nucleoside triphosphate hydrolase protein n=1 Tax=Fusarium redolens TaxID=48865 RepID=A0A9P9H2H3_FUSRE|nr:P-loop containing nucleoside triphosphate hydrolase protein [Fusarium redolens]KAH7248979.1 P-loop containing nucleoside triphosphate hydrolase protein [Fusarium redolens]
MNSSENLCTSSIDASFGPFVSPECRDGFDFTLVFEQSILVLSPAALLLILAPIRLFRLRNVPVKTTGHRLRTVKLALIALLAVLHLVLVVLWATLPSNSRLGRVSVAAACVSFASSLMSCVLSRAEHAKSPRPSSLLSLFLTVSLLLDVALLRTLWLVPMSAAIPAVFTAAFALKAILVVLEGWSKAPYLVAGSGVHSPEVTAGLYAQAVFAWVAPLLLTGFSKLLQPMDLFELDEDMGSAGLIDGFWRHWHNQKAPARKHRLISCCVTTLRRSIIAVVLPRLALLAFTICQPLILNRLLVFLDDTSQSINIGYGLIAAYGLVYSGIAFSQALYWHRNARSVTLLRGVLVSAVFSKAADLSITTTDDSAAVTLMSSDVDVILRAVREIHEFWANIIQLAIATWLLSTHIGYAASGPIIVSLLALVATVLVSALARKYQISWLDKTQKRVGITSAMVGHIKSIRCSGLAQNLSDTILNLRADEIKASRPFRIVSSVTSAIAQVPLLVSPVAAFALFQGVASASGETLHATRLFSALSLIILLAQPLFFMFEVILDMSAALGSFERIQTFLTQESRRDPRQQQSVVESNTPDQGDRESVELQILREPSLQSTANSSMSDVVIQLSNANISWSEDRVILRDLSFTVGRNQFVLLLGPVASGKTTLLKALLGEVPCTTGSINIHSKGIAWCEQSPWLLNQTIRKNIIGYSHFDPGLYQAVVKACDLEKDFSQLAQGDDTVIGSKGLALSGGQKQRVALARAVYSKPQVALFDDVFSGLDSQTARTVFENLFSERSLLRQWNTTTLLATQSVDFLWSADHTICLNNDGEISEQGIFSDLKDTGGYVQSLLRDRVHGVEASEFATDDIKEHTTKPAQTASKQQANEGDSRRQRGDSTVYRYYFSSTGGLFMVVLLVLEIIWAFLESFPTIWLKFWSDDNANGNDRAGYYLGIYAALQVTAVVWFAVLIWFVIVLVAAKSGRALHKRLLSTVIKAPLSLFTTTDLGSITTRFSQDIGMVDNHLPLGLVVTLASFFGVIAKAGLLASSNPYIAATFPLLGAVYFYLQRGYLRTSRQLRLLDLEEKAPLYTQFLETLSGLATIRAFGWKDAVIEANYTLVDRSQRPFYILMIVQRWLVLVLDLTTAALALLLVGLAVRLRGAVDVGLTGVSLVQLVSLSETVNILIQFWTSIETSIGAVARIKQFAEETGEENLPGETHEPPVQWPDKGAIQINNLTASYGDGDGDAIKALDAVSLEIKGGEKVGICGRTGSGKSSLFLALLRLLDPSSGNIIIDGISLSSLPRETIRSRLITLTQDQFVLPGTVRHNVDPLGVYSDVEIKEVLHLVELNDAIEQHGGLDASFNQDTLSHGQKQLFFLARAVLRKNDGRIVLLDEATSRQTEETIKAVIENEFKHHTVVFITHRLNTIIDFDRVIVMDKGCVVELGEPKSLLASDTKFKALWATGHRSGA